MNDFVDIIALPVVEITAGSILGSLLNDANLMIKKKVQNRIMSFGIMSILNSLALYASSKFIFQKLDSSPSGFNIFLIMLFAQQRNYLEDASTFTNEFLSK